MPTVGTDFTTSPLSAAFPSCFQIPSAFPVFAESSASLPLIPWLVLHGETGTKRILTPGSVFLCHTILSCLCQLGVFWRHSQRPEVELGCLHHWGVSPPGLMLQLQSGCSSGLPKTASRWGLACAKFMGDRWAQHLAEQEGGGGDSCGQMGKLSFHVAPKQPCRTWWGTSELVQPIEMSGVGLRSPSSGWNMGHPRKGHDLCSPGTPLLLSLPAVSLLDQSQMKGGPGSSLTSLHTVRGTATPNPRWHPSSVLLQLTFSSRLWLPQLGLGHSLALPLSSTRGALGPFHPGELISFLQVGLPPISGRSDCCPLGWTNTPYCADFWSTPDPGNSLKISMMPCEPWTQGAWLGICIRLSDAHWPACSKNMDKSVFK